MPLRREFLAQIPLPALGEMSFKLPLSSQETSEQMAAEPAYPENPKFYSTLNYIEVVGGLEITLYGQQGERNFKWRLKFPCKEMYNLGVEWR